MTEAASTNRQWIRSAVDFGALAAFALAFVILRARGVDSSEALVQATWALVGGSAVALAVGFFVERRLALLPLLTGGFALVFGVLTLFFDDALFVKLKVTVLNLFLAALLLGGTLMGKYPLKALLGDAIKVNDAAWRTLTLRYGVYFLAVALVNEVVRSPAAVTAIWSWMGRGTPDAEAVWVGFRGVLWIAASIFGVSQLPLIMKNLTKDEPPGPTSPDTGL
ncbi:inner membrane-spanning protein YciB [Brevundimonas sp.]|uniref:inner membrane-spanning protein YciB n=1 Tax=Brevundimonas sp. TaxID=1871086 RepID=UPI002FD977BC